MGSLQSVSNDTPIESAVVGAPGVAIPNTTTSDAQSPSSTGGTRPTLVAILSAAIILGLFGWLFHYMIDKSASDHWDRLIALYNSVQTIVVAAVGALLGAQVSAGQATVARAQSDDARRRATTLETNIKAFQADIARSDRCAESSGLPDRERLLLRAMTLLH